MTSAGMWVAYTVHLHMYVEDIFYNIDIQREFFVPPYLWLQHDAVSYQRCFLFYFSKEIKEKVEQKKQSNSYKAPL